MASSVSPEEQGASGTSRLTDDTLYTIHFKEMHTVRYIGSETFRGGDSVHKLMNLMEEKHGFPKDESQLICNGMIIDSGVISDYTPDQGNVVWVQRLEVHDVQVFVHGITGGIITINLKSNALVSDLKSEIRERYTEVDFNGEVQYQYEIDQIYLLFNSKALVGNRKLSSYGMREKADVQFVCRQTGGSA